MNHIREGSRVQPKAIRRQFLRELGHGLHVTWPIFSGLIGVQVTLGVIIGLIEDWPWRDTLYFTFVTGLTIGYGDVVPRTGIARVLAILIGFSGVLLTALVATIGVKAMRLATDFDRLDR